MPIIEFNNVTKEFKLGELHSFKTSLLNRWRRLIRKPIAERPLFRALDEINISVEPGEVLGIIGHNGAGKSTLLKLLARISKPTAGQITAKGRIAPLIEVGAGFVSELTGRENVYLNGSIMGLSRKAIAQKFDEIVDFAEMAEFIDTPIKRYSSGMKVKLAFSVATSIESEILIIDEVLAVGDLAFQRKCFDRMEGLIKRQGRTVLLVSHNIRQVARMCSRVCLLDHGRVIEDGPPEEVCEAFYALSNKKIASQKIRPGKQSRNLRFSGEVLLKQIILLDKEGNETQELEMGGAVTIRCIFDANKLVQSAEIVYGFHTTDFIYIASMGTAHLEHASNLSQGINEIDCKIERLLLMPGVYAIRVGVLDEHRSEMFYGETLKVFSIKAKDIPVTKMAIQGLVHIPASWEFRSKQVAVNS